MSWKHTREKERESERKSEREWKKERNVYENYV